MFIRQISRQGPRVARQFRAPRQMLSQILAPTSAVVPTIAGLPPPAASFLPAAARAYAAPSLCFQCEQTEEGKGCLTSGAPGVCGKTPETARLQDLFIHQLEGIAQYTHAARAIDPASTNPDLDSFILNGMFTTLTNVNFNADGTFDVRS